LRVVLLVGAGLGKERGLEATAEGVHTGVERRGRQWPAAGETFAGGEPTVRGKTAKNNLREVG